jgi:hypothetical protein
VVYDLQSGTLFKKWKAGANTVAVSIACQNSCVVTSLQDARILVWDLVTGLFAFCLFEIANIYLFTLGKQAIAAGVYWAIQPL